MISFRCFLVILKPIHSKFLWYLSLTRFSPVPVLKPPTSWKCYVQGPGSLRPLQRSISRGQWEDESSQILSSNLIIICIIIFSFLFGRKVLEKTTLSSLAFVFFNSNFVFYGYVFEIYQHSNLSSP